MSNSLREARRIAASMSGQPYWDIVDAIAHIAMNDGDSWAIIDYVRSICEPGSDV